MSQATPRQPPPPVSPLTRRALWIIFGTGTGLILLGVWLVFAMLPGLLNKDTSESPSPSPAAAETTRRIQAKLYYVSDDGTELTEVKRDVLYAAATADQARRIVEAQIEAAPSGLVSAIPPETKVRAVFLTGRGIAYVDLSADISRSHSGGSLNECLAVFAIVNALTANLTGVNAVQILVDGKEVDTLAGHVDLRQPLERATKWVRKVQ